jgi:hypothetical protein
LLKYDEKLFLPLLMEASKFLMFNMANATFDLHSQVYSTSLFHTTTTTINTYGDIVSRELVGF